MIGLLCISIPILIYFYKLNALDEMLFASFLFNFQYVKIGEVVFSFHKLFPFRFVFPFIILFIGSIIYYKREKNFQILLFSVLLFIFGIVSTVTGKTYGHYVILNLPCLVMGLIFLFSKSKNIYPIIFMGISLAFLVKNGNNLYNNMISKNEIFSKYKNQSKEIISVIPLGEYNSIYVYETNVNFYLFTDIIPPYKYFVFQEWHAKSHKQILDDINTYIENDSPIWIVTELEKSQEGSCKFLNKQGYESENKGFKEIIDDKYVLFKKNELFELYKLRN